MTATDRLDDDYPHGTRLGYEKGCRGRCPAGDEHGLSCKRAKVLAAGDYQYQKLFRRGASPAEIAEHLGLVPDVHAGARPGSAAETPVAPAAVEDGGDEPEPAAPSKSDSFEVFTKQHTRSELPEGVTRADVRLWARENGIQVNDRGALPRAVIEAYTTREDTPTTEPESEIVGEDDETWEVLDVEVIPDNEPAPTPDSGLLDALSQLISLGADPAVWVHRAVILAAANVTEELVLWVSDVASHGVLDVEDARALNALGITVQGRESTALDFVLQKWAAEHDRADAAATALAQAERTLRIDDQEIERLLTESTVLHQEIRTLRAQLDQKRPRLLGRAS